MARIILNGRRTEASERATVLEAAVQAARLYGARYLVLEKLHSRAYQPLYDGTTPDLRLVRAAIIGETQIYAIANFRGFLTGRP